MKETASVSIKYDTYERLKSFCVDNGLKITDTATKLIREGLMREMYGDIPYGRIIDPFGIAKPGGLVGVPEDSGVEEQNVEPLEKWTEIVAQAANDEKNSLGEIIEADEVIKIGSDMPVDTKTENADNKIKKGRGKRTLK